MKCAPLLNGAPELLWEIGPSSSAADFSAERMTGCDTNWVSYGILLYVYCERCGFVCRTALYVVLLKRKKKRYRSIFRGARLFYHHLSHVCAPPPDLISAKQQLRGNTAGKSFPFDFWPHAVAWKMTRARRRYKNTTFSRHFQLWCFCVERKK